MTATPVSIRTGVLLALSVAVTALAGPFPYTRKSITQGRGVFARYCVSCHGNDGKATVDVVADATDLTAPKTWKYGTSESAIYRSIRDGQGASMPSFKTQIKKDDDLWHLVNFIQSLWPEPLRPALQEDK
jgi:cbb3-type cytochrome c oxidase subunit III